MPANAGTSAVTTPVTGELVLQTIADPDSESEAITLTLDLVAHGNVGSDGTTVLALPAGASPRDVTIVDLDIQRFEWTVTTSRPAEGSPIGITLAAVPAPDRRGPDAGPPEECPHGAAEAPATRALRRWPRASPSGLP